MNISSTMLGLSPNKKGITNMVEIEIFLFYFLFIRQLTYLKMCDSWKIDACLQVRSVKPFISVAIVMISPHSPSVERL